MIFRGLKNDYHSQNDEITFYTIPFMDADLLRKRIKEKLSEKGISMSHAEKVGNMKIGSLRQFMRGRSKNPTLDTLNSIAKVFEISASDLLNESTSPKYTDQQNLPWNNEIFREIVNSLSALVNKAETTLKSEDAITIIRNLYYSYSPHDQQNIDMEWLLNKMMGKK